MTRLAAAIACLLALAFAPRAGGPPLYVPVSPSPYMPVYGVWRGATLYGTGKPVTVRFVHSIATWGHQLFFMDPDSGAAVPLLIYRNGDTRDRCPDSGGLAADLGVRDSGQEIVFMLKTVWSGAPGEYCTGEACGPRYTGRNEADSRFHSRGEYAHLLGFRWSQMARIPRDRADALPPPCTGAAWNAPADSGVLVSFNDGANETFDDLVILVTGVQMDVERDPPQPDTARSRPRRLSPACVVEAEAGGVAEGEDFIPRKLALPLSAIRPRATPSERPFFLDEAWRDLYPGRPDETAFPNGPEIRVTAPGPFRFDLAFFTNQGEFVNRARGEVTEDMLRPQPFLPDGRRAVSLMWYPASERGLRVSTGAYLVKGRIRYAPGTRSPAGPSPACGAAEAEVLSAFGYLRH